MLEFFLSENTNSRIAAEIPPERPDMKRNTLAFLLPIVLVVSSVASAEPTPAWSEWTGSSEQKLWGLMTVWAEVKYTFPHFDRLPDLD